MVSWFWVPVMGPGFLGVGAWVGIPGYAFLGMGPWVGLPVLLRTIGRFDQYGFMLVHLLQIWIKPFWEVAGANHEMCVDAHIHIRCTYIDRYTHM